jgi:hypothetical protein
LVVIDEVFEAHGPCAGGVSLPHPAEQLGLGAGPLLALEGFFQVLHGDETIAVDVVASERPETMEYKE